MNKKEIKKGRHSQEPLLGISLLYVVNQIGKIPYLIKDKKAGDPRLQHSGMTAYFMKNQAFTLIELLVVVLIIGILAAIALPQYQKAVMKARLATIKPILSSIKEAEEIYYMANGQYTPDISQLDIKIPCTMSEGDESAFYCDNYFNIDNIMADGSDERWLYISAHYCPGHAQRPVNCQTNSQFSYIMYFNKSSHPGRISCSGNNSICAGENSN